MNILVTGGAGYIGSHTVRALIQAGFTPIVVDNFSRGHRSAIPKGVKVIELDIADSKLVNIMKDNNIKGIMHFAAHSQVGESMINPSIYYENNVVGSYRLIESARQAGVQYFVFSSTAAVYGEPEEVPIVETAKLQPTNVYGRTKLMIEEMLHDYSAIYGSTYVALRYFNAAGADESGNIGEDHSPETHLIPLVLEAALKKRPHITVFGTDYDTSDGTCIETAKNVTKIDIPVEYGDRRAGDPSTLIASSDCIKNVLGWNPQHSELSHIIGDAWRWHQSHPMGYDDK